MISYLKLVRGIAMSMNKEKEIVLNDLERLRAQQESYMSFKKLFVPSMDYYKKTLGEVKSDEVILNLRLFLKHNKIFFLPSEDEEYDSFVVDKNYFETKSINELLSKAYEINEQILSPLIQKIRTTEQVLLKMQQVEEKQNQQNETFDEPSIKISGNKLVSDFLNGTENVLKKLPLKAKKGKQDFLLSQGTLWINFQKKHPNIKIKQSTFFRYLADYRKEDR